MASSRTTVPAPWHPLRASYTDCRSSRSAERNTPEIASPPQQPVQGVKVHVGVHAEIFSHQPATARRARAGPFKNLDRHPVPRPQSQPVREIVRHQNPFPRHRDRAKPRVEDPVEGPVRANPWTAVGSCGDRTAAAPGPIGTARRAGRPYAPDSDSARPDAGSTKATVMSSRCASRNWCPP